MKARGLAPLPPLPVILGCTEIDNLSHDPEGRALAPGPGPFGRPGNGFAPPGSPRGPFPTRRRAHLRNSADARMSALACLEPPHTAIGFRKQMRPHPAHHIVDAAPSRG